jgi:hypothetical protein
MVKEHFAVMVEIALQAERAFGLESPIFLRKANIERATKPRAPASMVSKTALQGEDLSLLILQQRGSYRSCFLRLASKIPSSAGHVSSTMRTLWRDLDQNTMSGRWEVE